MTNYLEILALGCAFETQPSGPPYDRAGRYFPSDGRLYVSGRRSALQAALPTLRKAIDERLALARRLISGDKPVYAIRYGLCDSCGQSQETYKAGRCTLCCAAIQKAKDLNREHSR